MSDVRIPGSGMVASCWALVASFVLCALCFEFSFQFKRAAYLKGHREGEMARERDRQTDRQRDRPT